MDCSYSCDNQPHVVDPYADISGSGVIAGFAGTAYMVMLLLLIYYVFVFNPRLDPFREPGNNTEETPYSVNPVDDIILSTIRSFMRQKIGLSRFMAHYERLGGGRLEDTFNKCVLVLADTQIITGLAILISGFASINCRLSSYHWQIIFYLAWLSSMTHLSTLTFLRSYLYHHPPEYFSRLILMLVLVTLLCGAVIPTAFFDFTGYDSMDFEPSYYVICFYERKMDTNTLAFRSMLLYILLSVYGYTIRIFKLSNWAMKRSHNLMDKINRLFNRHFKTWDPLERPQTMMMAWKELVFRPLFIALLGVLTVQLSLFGSFIVEIYWLVISLSWGTLNLFRVRNYGPRSERAFTFGQVLPLIMLAAPLLSIFENIIDIFYSNTDKKHTVEHESHQHARPERIILDRPNQPLDINANAFYGALTLAICSYLEYGLYIFVFQRLGLLEPLIDLPFEAFMYQPLIQVVWLVHALWLEKFDCPQNLRSYFQRILLASLLALSFISFFGAGDYETEGYGILVMLGVYLLTCAWIKCELRTAESSLQSRWFIRFTFSSITFGAATAGYFLSNRTYTTESYIYMALIYSTVVFSSLSLLSYTKSPIIANVSGLFAFALIITLLSLNYWLGDPDAFTFTDVIHILLVIISINSLPFFIFTILSFPQIFTFSSQVN